MMNEHKQQLIRDFSADIARMLVDWEIHKDINMERRAMLAYANQQSKKTIQWNLWWQRDLQTVWETIGPHWKDPATSRAVYEAFELLTANAAFAKLGVHWSIPLRTAARDALLLSASIVAHGELSHPICQHASARWSLWKNNTFVLGDHKNEIIGIPFVDKAKR